MFPLLDVTHKYPVGAWAASTRRWQSLSASAVSRFQIRICYQRRRSQAGPQRPAPSLLAARSSHHRPATELAVSRPRAPRRRRAPAPPLPASHRGLQRAPPALFPGRDCASLGRRRAAQRGGGRRGPQTWGGRPHLFPRAAGSQRGAGDPGRARGGGGGARLQRARVVHPAVPDAPRARRSRPGPGPGYWGRGEEQAAAQRESGGPAIPRSLGKF